MILNDRVQDKMPGLWYTSAGHITVSIGQCPMADDYFDLWEVTFRAQ